MAAVGIGDNNCWAEVNGQQVEVACPDGVLASSEKASQRMATCKACPSYVSILSMCSECGCLLPAKTKINISVCPLGKW